MILNPWDVQSKHIHILDGKASALYAGECRYGGGECYVLTLIGKVKTDGKDRMGSWLSSAERLKGTWDRISGRKSSDPQGSRHGCGTDKEEGYDISKENRTVDGEFPPRQL